MSAEIDGSAVLMCKVFCAPFSSVLSVCNTASLHWTMTSSVWYWYLDAEVKHIEESPSCY